MTHHTRNLGLVLTMALALTLAGCGNPQSSESSGPAANITFRTDPVGVQVWIDGTNEGTTPVVIAVDAGQHEIELKRDGFASVKDALSVEAGKDLTVKSALTVTGDDEESRFKTLLAAIGIERHENLEGKTHRGAMKNGVMLYWPQRKVRREGMSTWRIEFGIDYEDDATLEFRKGKKVLHRMPLIATSQVVEGALPPAVMEELKRGTSITWGAYFEGRKKKDVTAKFKVDSGKSLQKKLEKLKRRSVYRRASPLERELIKIELKRNYRFYTEALTDAMSVMNTWDDTQLADKVIVDSLQRLKLKDSMLYVEIMQRVGGRGPNGRATGGQAGLGTVTRPLSQSLVAPKVRAPAADSGAQAGPKAGLGVTPTTGDQKRAPGPVEAPGTPTEDEGVKADQAKARESAEQDRRNLLHALEEQVHAIEQEGQASKERDAAVDAAEEALKKATDASNAGAQAVKDAEEKIQRLGPGGSAADKTDAADGLEQAQAKLADAEEQLREAKGTKYALSQKPASEQGSGDETKEKLKALNAQIEELRKAGLAHSGNPDGSDVPRRDGKPNNFDDPLDPQPPQHQPANTREELEATYKKAMQSASDAKDWAESTAQILRDADIAMKAAEKALNDAEEAVQAGKPKGPQALEEAEAAMQQSFEDGSRANMENERARGTAERTKKELAEAKEAFDGHGTNPGDN